MALDRNDFTGAWRLFYFSDLSLLALACVICQCIKSEHLAKNLDRTLSWFLAAALGLKLASVERHRGNEFFCLAVAFLAYDYSCAKRFWRLLALVCIIVAGAYRHNALSAGAIFMVYLVYREVSLHSQKPLFRKKIIAVGSVLLIAGVQLVLMLPTYLLKLDNEPLWPLQSQWDIAAVSVYENKLLFSPGWSSPQLTMEVLKRDFDPSVNVPLFKSSLIYVNPYYPMTDKDFSLLKKTWLRLPIDYPKAYWQHRAYVSKNLLGWQQDLAHPNYVFDPQLMTYKDNPPIISVQKPIAKLVQTKLSSMTETPLFYGWAYALLALFVFVLALIRRHWFTAMISLSGLCYVLPLIILVPSSDFRYLAWLLLASMLAVVSLFAMPADMRYKR